MSRYTIHCFISLIVCATALANIPINATWVQNGTTIAGGNGFGNASNQLYSPYGVYVHDDEAIFIADSGNHRVVEWKKGATAGRVMAGGKTPGNGTGQLYQPTDVIIEKENNSVIICDNGNGRIVSWSLQRGTKSGEILISNVACSALAIDDHRNLYVADMVKNEVRRYRIGEKTGILVAGGNGQGNGTNQFDMPTKVFVDREYSVYVSDFWNHRVMKWMKGATEGIVVAGGQGDGSELTQVSRAQGLFVDGIGTTYVVDEGNNRVANWCKGAKQGTVVVGGNGEGTRENQFDSPIGLSFDRDGNLYVTDRYNHRVQRFSVIKNS